MNPFRATLLSIAWMCLLAPSYAVEPPNIVVMMADDMGLGDTSAYQDFTGNSDSDQIATPAMERLARMGVRFTDAHTPSSRCSPTRYALLTGRYPWRNRLKHWVLFGVQGDPMIEADRPTLATLMRSQGYRTGMVGKWHVGLRYRQSDGQPAAGWEDADLTQPLHDTPLDHGFDFCRFTSRSHGTSGVSAQGKKKRNSATQSVGPGHIHGRTAVSATGDGKRLLDDGANAYVLDKLGSRHFGHAIDFLDDRVTESDDASKPFFLYYASNSNHAPYTPDKSIDGVAVAGAATNVAGQPMNVRSDYIYENDVALGRLIDYLESKEDPRRPGHKLIDNTIVIFTSDNGAEKDNNTATGPFRSHKGSAYEGGHRVPFIVAWKGGGVGDGDAATAGVTSDALLSLQDMYATFADVLSVPLPDLAGGQKGGEDSVSVLAAWKGDSVPSRPLFFNDHKQATDHAAVAIRQDDPIVEGTVQSGKWKLFFDASLLRAGELKPIELYDLATDPRELTDRLAEPEHRQLVAHLARQALLHRTVGGHRLAPFASPFRIQFSWLQTDDSEDGATRQGDRIVYPVGGRFAGQDRVAVVLADESVGLEMRVSSDGASEGKFQVNGRGLGLDGGRFGQVENGEAILIGFDRDVIVESVSIVAGNGICGGFYRVGEQSPLAIYCVDGDIDAQDQSGILSDIGVLQKGETLRLDASSHLGVETAGQWRLADMTIRLVEQP